MKLDVTTLDYTLSSNTCLHVSTHAPNTAGGLAVDTLNQNTVGMRCIRRAC